MQKRFALYLGVLLSFYLVLFLGLVDSALLSDFAKFHASAQLHLEGKSIYTRPEVDRFVQWDFDLGPKPQLTYPNLNPPFLTLLVLPLAPLRYPEAWWIWSVLSLFCGMAAMARLEITTRSGPARVNRQLGFQLLLLAFYPTFANMEYGQVSLFLFWPVVEAWIAARRGADLLAGFWLGLALALKPFFGLFGLFFLVRRRWLLLLSMGATFSICTLLSVAVFGWSTLQEYRSVVGDITWVGTNWNASFLGIFSRFLGGSDSAPLLEYPQLARILASLGSVLAATLLALLAHRDSRPSIDLGYALTLALMLLISPLGWAYYFPWLLLSYLIGWQALSDLPAQAAQPWWSLLIVSFLLSASPIPLQSALYEYPPWHWYLWSGVHSYALLLAAVLAAVWAKLISRSAQIAA